MKVAIVLPNTGIVQQRTVASLTALIYQYGGDLTYFSPSLAGMSAVRNHGAKMALDDEDVTHLLWVDSDMTFPPDALDRLLAHDTSIVGCAYSKRNGKGIVGAGTDGQQLASVPRDKLHEVSVLGFGLMLVKREVFEKLDYPWFYEPWVEGHGPVSEDAYFLLKAREKGYKVFMDAGLSHEVGHLGITEYRLPGGE